MALEGFQRARRLALFALLMAALPPLAFIGASGSEETHHMVEAIGAGLIVIGIVGRMWCTLYIGGRKAAEIVDAGPYSISRNPLYLFSSLAAAGVGAQTGSATVAALFLVASVAAFRLVIRREESFLKQRFGPSYRLYLDQVPRFFPRLSRFRDETQLTVRTSLIYRTLTDGLVFFVAMPVFELAEFWQERAILPILLRLP